MSRAIKFFSLTFSEGINVLIGFLFLPYLARALDVSDYGTYGQALMIISLVQGVFAFGLSKVIFVFLADPAHRQNETLFSNTAAAFFSGVGAACIVCLVTPLIGAQFDNPSVKPLLFIGAWTLPFALVASSLNSALIFFDRVKQSASIAVLTNLVRVLVIVGAIQLYHSLILIFFGLVLVEVVRLLLCYTNLPKDILRPYKVSKHLTLDQIKAGWPLGVASILGVAFYSTDGYMVSVMLDVEQYAIYRNGAFQIPFISTMYGAITAILLPDVSKYFFEKNYDEIVRLKKAVISNTAMLIFPMVVFCILFAKPLITLYLSEVYIASYPIFMVYNLMLLARFTSYDDLFIATKNNRLMPPIYVLALALNIGLNYILIQLYGPLGSAIASVISFYLLIIILFRKGVSFLEKKPSDFFDLKKIIGALGLSLGLSVAFFGVYSFINLGSISMLIFMGVYAVLVYHLIVKLRMVDREIINRLVSRLFSNNLIGRLYFKIYS